MKITRILNMFIPTRYLIFAGGLTALLLIAPFVVTMLPRYTPLTFAVILLISFVGTTIMCLIISSNKKTQMVMKTMHRRQKISIQNNVVIEQLKSLNNTINKYNHKVDEKFLKLEIQNTLDMREEMQIRNKALLDDYQTLLTQLKNTNMTKSEIKQELQALTNKHMKGWLK